MRNKGLPLSCVLDRPAFSLFIFGKRGKSATPIVTFTNEGFAVAVGTLIYRGQTGIPALAAIYNATGHIEQEISRMIGAFALMIFKNGKFFLLSDYHGTYSLFASEDGRLISSSFLSVLASIDRPHLSDQEVYEYLLDGTTYGFSTVVEQVRRLDPAMIHLLQPNADAIPKQRLTTSVHKTFEGYVEAAIAGLSGVMNGLCSVFADRTLIALSGGYDSRLLLAAALQTGLRPRAFVGGPASSAEVTIAQQVARVAGVEICQQDPTQQPTPLPEELPALVGERLHYFDGLGIRGLFGQGAELRFRLARLGGGTVELNGSGGEIYRDFWKLPGWQRTPRSFARKVLLFKSLGRLGAVTERFQSEAYVYALESKLRQTLRASERAMSSAQVAALYTVLRSERFAGSSIKEMNLLGYSFLPFAQPQLTTEAHAIPLRYRIQGRLETAMIRQLHPGLAAVQSIYGHTFAERLPIRLRMKDVVERYARDLAPLRLVSQVHKRLKRVGESGLQPAELSDRHIVALFGRRRLEIEAYVVLDRMRALGDPTFLSRALTLELLIREGRM